MKKHLLIILSGLLFSCAETRSDIAKDTLEVNDKNSYTKSVKYTCDRDTQLSVNFSLINDKQIAIINGFNSQAIILPNKTASSGFLYSNGKYTLRGKDNSATWSVGRMRPLKCSLTDEFTFLKDTK